MDADEIAPTIYRLGWWITFVPTFLVCWIYCIDRYGFLLGVGFGWLPSAITGAIVAFLWPLIVIAVIWMFKH